MGIEVTSSATTMAIQGRFQKTISTKNVLPTKFGRLVEINVISFYFFYTFMYFTFGWMFLQKQMKE